MGVPAEDTVGTACVGIGECAFLNLVAQAKPARTQAIQPSRHTLLAGVELLRAVVEPLEKAAEQDVAIDEAIELVAVNGKVAFAAVLPYVALIDGHADQVRHELRQPDVVIALDPDDLAAALGIAELAYGREELPVRTGEPAEVKVVEDVAEQDELTEVHRLDQVHGVGGTAHLRPQVQIGQDQRVAGGGGKAGHARWLAFAACGASVGNGAGLGDGRALGLEPRLAVRSQHELRLHTPDCDAVNAR